ncbi:tRNA U54 and U55 pseudouridine synthase Pus10 [Bradyrhizobium sp. USDA 4508]|nr:tRNA U54 and U55 pseudouridine synthase Pus10 [Bradyrhizobium sp. USDA 4541]
MTKYIVTVEGDASYLAEAVAGDDGRAWPSWRFGH